jgi:NhaP-type Na+/H+ or K+/H+ antiporter
VELFIGLMGHIWRLAFPVGEVQPSLFLPLSLSLPLTLMDGGFSIISAALREGASSVYNFADYSIEKVLYYLFSVEGLPLQEKTN